jgi:hypothetical protein
MIVHFDVGCNDASCCEDISITSLSLIPDTNLAQTGQSVNFSASYNMGADNLIFEWNIEGTVTNV